MNQDRKRTKFYFSTNALLRDIFASFAPALLFLLLYFIFYPKSHIGTIFGQIIGNNADDSFSWLKVVIGISILATISFVVGEFVNRIANKIEPFLVFNRSVRDYNKLYQHYKNTIDEYYKNVFSDFADTQMDFLGKKTPLKEPFLNEIPNDSSLNKFKYLKNFKNNWNIRKDAAFSKPDANRARLSALLSFMREQNPPGYANVYRVYYKRFIIQLTAWYSLFFGIAVLLTESFNPDPDYIRLAFSVLFSILVFLFGIHEKERIIDSEVRYEYQFLVESWRLYRNSQKDISSK